MSDKKIYRILRHGDVILYKLSAQQLAEKMQQGVLSRLFGNKNELPQPPPMKGNPRKHVLAYGETTGHSHVLEGDFDVLAEDAGKNELSFRVNSSAVLTHEEHDRIVLDEGIYLKVTQVEYDPFNDLIRQIRD